MALNLGLLITMGSVSMAGIVIEILLGKMGKISEANLIGFVTTAMLVSTVVFSVVKVFAQIRQLGLM